METSTRGWVGPRCSLDAVTKRDIPVRNRNHGAHSWLNSCSLIHLIYVGTDIKWQEITFINTFHITASQPYEQSQRRSTRDQGSPLRACICCFQCKIRLFVDSSFGLEYSVLCPGLEGIIQSFTTPTHLPASVRLTSPYRSLFSETPVARTISYRTC